MISGALATTLVLLGGPTAAAPAGIKWTSSIDEATRLARAQRKPILVDFWAKWCGWCKKLDHTTYVDPAVTRLAEGFVALKVNAEGAPHEVEFAARYDVATLPTIAILSPGGRLVSRVSGYQGPGRFPRTLEAARGEAQKVMGWEAVLAKHPKDPTALTGLGTHLFEQEFYDEARDLLQAATHVDEAQPIPDRRRTRMLLAIIQNYDRQYPEAELLLKDALGLGPQGEDQPKLLFILGRTYVSWGRRSEARETMLVLLRDFAETPLAQKARDTLAGLERKAQQ
jgi:thioredoxin-like negative regulator of GroEL